MKRTLGQKENRGLRLARLLGALGVVFFCLAAAPAPDGVLSFQLGLSPCLADPSSPQPEQKDAKPSETRAASITVYVTSWCPACRMTTDYLKEKKVPFTVKDVEKNSDYRKEMVDKVGGYRGVPVVDIDGKIILGFNPYIFDDLLK